MTRLRLRLLVVGVVGLDVSAVVAAALDADGVEDDAEVFGLDLPQCLARALEDAAAVGAGADDGDAAVDAGWERYRLAGDEQRAAVEDHVVVGFEVACDEVDEEVALEELGGVDRLHAAREDAEVGE